MNYARFCKFGHIRICKYNNYVCIHACGMYVIRYELEVATLQQIAKVFMSLADLQKFTLSLQLHNCM